MLDYDDPRLRRVLDATCERYRVDRMTWHRHADTAGLSRAIQDVTRGHIVPGDRTYEALLTREGPGPDLVRMSLEDANHVWGNVLQHREIVAPVPNVVDSFALAMSPDTPDTFIEDQNIWRIHLCRDRKSVEFERIRGPHVEVLRRAGWSEHWPVCWRRGEDTISIDRAPNYGKRPPTNRRAKRDRCKSRRRIRLKS